MHFLYHHVPKKMQGHILYPLNMLQKKLPKIYEDASKKYEDRPNVPRQRIPLFNNCLWNDVMFLMSMHPQRLMDIRRKVGWPDIGPQQYFKIDPTKLDQSKLGIYLFKPIKQSMQLTENDFTPYHYDDLEKYSIIPQETQDYFKAELDNGQQRIRLFYRYIPHILYYGKIDVTDAEIITVS